MVVLFSPFKQQRLKVKVDSFKKKKVDVDVEDESKLQILPNFW